MPEKEPTSCNRLKVWHGNYMNGSTSCMRLVAWMCLSMVTFSLMSRSETESSIMQTPTPIRFDEPDASGQWVTVNDNVMGGRSIGDFTIKEGKLIFRGSTNTNGGGFSSIRSRPLERDMSAVAAFRVRCKGDGRTYLLSCRTKETYRGMQVAYRAPFETQAGKWVEIVVPMSAFKPSFRGMDLSRRAPKLEGADILSMGLMIYDKKDGPFDLVVEWIGFQDSAL